MVGWLGGWLENWRVIPISAFNYVIVEVVAEIGNTLKIKVFIKSILFCKYLRNGSSDLYKILCASQLLSYGLRLKISWRSVQK